MLPNLAVEIDTKRLSKIWRPTCMHTYLHQHSHAHLVRNWYGAFLRVWSGPIPYSHLEIKQTRCHESHKKNTEGEERCVWGCGLTEAATEGQGRMEPEASVDMQLVSRVVCNPVDADARLQ
ncbi:unnamed protein product [Boreogadus saida]